MMGSVKLHDGAVMLTATKTENMVLVVAKFCAGCNQPLG